MYRAGVLCADPWRPTCQQPLLCGPRCCGVTDVAVTDPQPLPALLCCTPITPYPTPNPRSAQLGDPSFFLKGLSVVDDIAFFGIAPMTQRADRADPTLNCHLAAYDLKERVLLWWRQLPTHGLLNVVSCCVGRTLLYLRGGGRSGWGCVGGEWGSSAWQFWGQRWRCLRRQGAQERQF